MTGAALDRVLDALRTHGSRVTTTSGTTMAQCPAHEDGRPSLHVDSKDGKVLLQCFAGCDTREIVSAIGLQLGDLFDAAAQSTGSDEWMPGGLQFVASYDYTDEHGTLLFQVVRGMDATGGKSFLQRHPDPGKRSGWCWKLSACLPDDRRFVPWHLPDVLDAVRRGAPVWIAEGEKDADAIRRHGVVATCNAGGAGKWRAQHSAWLKGAHVVITRDLDEPGAKHQKQVEQSLAGVAASVRLVEPAKGKDAFDHFAAGLTLDDFASVVGRPTAASGEVASQARQKYGQSQDGSGKASAASAWGAPRQWEDDNLVSHQRMAARFTTYADGKCLFVNGGGWHYWDGTRWAPDSDASHAYGILREVITLSWIEAMADKGLQGDVRSAMTAMGGRGVLEIASKTLRSEEMDVDPWLLNCANGTLDLHTLQLKPHDPADKITRVTAAAYDPEAKSEAWDYLTSTSIVDPEIRGFLQRYAGVALVGRVIEHVLVILTGDVGRNGKGMTARTIYKALGDYAVTSPSSMLLAKRQGSTPSAQDLSAQYKLRGARWSVMSEVNKGSRMDESAMKMLTGGDEIPAKLMGQNYVNFAASHSFVMLANDLPIVDPDAKAAWSRLRAVPFPVDFTGREDKTLEERLESQLDGVLAWCVEGLRDYLARGRKLDEPESVLARTAAYRDDNDALGRFIAEECIEHPHARIVKGNLVDAYTEWAVRNREERLSARAIGTRLKGRKGVSEVNGTHGREWHGIGLPAADDHEHPDAPEPENPVTRPTNRTDTTPSHSHERTTYRTAGETVGSVGRPDLDPDVLDPQGLCRLHHEHPVHGCYTCDALNAAS